MAPWLPVARPAAGAGPSMLRLRGGGGDGGVYPLTHTEMQWMTSANVGRGEGAWTHQWADKASEEALRRDRATLCAVSSKPLEPPIVVTDLGILCNKEELLEKLLTKAMPSHLEHVMSLRDFAEAKLHPNPHYKGDGVKDGQAAEDVEVPYICPVSGIPMNGRLPFVFIRSSGHVVSERALKTVGSKVCPVTDTPCNEDDIVWLHPNDEQREQLVARQEARRAAAKAKKKAKKMGGGEVAITANLSSAPSSAQGKKHANVPAVEVMDVSNGAVAQRPADRSIGPKANGMGKQTEQPYREDVVRGAAPKREREWEKAIKEKAASSAVYKSLFLSSEDRKRMEAEDNNNFAARGIPMSLSRTTKFTM